MNHDLIIRVTVDDTEFREMAEYLARRICEIFGIPRQYLWPPPVVVESTLQYVLIPERAESLK